MSGNVDITAEESKPAVWEKMGHETPRAYEAFEVYRDMGVSRSIAKAAQYLSKAIATLSAWSQRYNWVYRVSVWDAEQRRLLSEEKEAKRKAAVNKEGELAGAVLAQVARHLTPPKFHNDGVTELTPEERRAWKAKPEIVRMATYALRYGSEIERLALGLPTVITRNMQEQEQMVRDGLEAQRVVMSIIAEGLCEEPDCDCCRRIRDRLAQASDYQSRVQRQLTPTTAD